MVGVGVRTNLVEAVFEALMKAGEPLSHEELAARSGVSIPTIRKIARDQGSACMKLCHKQVIKNGRRVIRPAFSFQPQRSQHGG